ncbi:MAG: ABC transporter permease [Bacteroidetes bacterium]|nr:ABC transporter permease [Bacteroidota bacterium]
MLKNYFKTAWRNLVKNKSFSLINILGLSVGISVCFIIMMYVMDELSYDRFNKNADRIVRISFKANMNGGKINEASVMPPTAQTLKYDYPEVEIATRLRDYGIPKVILNDKKFNAGRLAFVDANFFSVFTFQFLQGDPANALQLPNTIVITEEMAKTYFGNQDPIGKTLKFNNDGDDLYKVKGVFKKLPSNSHFHFDMLASMASLPEAKSTSWMQSNFYTYLLLQKGYDYKKLEAKLPDMVEKYMGPQIMQAMHISLSQFRTKGNELGFVLQPLTDIHLHSINSFELEPSGDIKYVYIFGAIAIFMLAIACINFINLSTASASKRAKEVGVRKVLGSGKWELVKQFLLESVLLAFMAILISIVFVQLALPVFNSLSGKNLQSALRFKNITSLLLLGLFVGIVAGIYPAFFLSSFQPIAVLKNKLRRNVKSLSLRSSLVVFQFFISVCLIVGTIVVSQQMKFIQNKKLGYDKEQLLVIPNSYLLGSNEKVFKDELLKDPRVVNATVSAYRPAGPTNSNNSMLYPDGDENKLIRTLRYDVDEQYIPTLGMSMVAGRNFSKDMSTDSSGVIINETAANTFGWGDKAIGHTLTWMNDNSGGKLSLHVIGVVKDFNFKSLHEAITPLIMVLQPESGLIVKIKTADVAGLLSSMKQAWASYKTEEPFTYAFMDDLYNNTYLAEQKSGTILNIFAALTIFVACLGLFGLATYTAEQRTKEIGIRKVLGASVSQVTGMLSKDFLKLILIACVLAFPVAWWAMNNWLKDFAYRIHISVWVFVLATVAVIVVALVTISYQAIKAALANPVKSLRTE